MESKVKEETLEEYLKTVERNQYFKVCKARKEGQIGLGYRKSLSDTPIPCKVLASFMCLGGGGYFVRKLKDNKIMQVQSFRETKSKQTGFFV
jgi:hypothetical protein